MLIGMGDERAVSSSRNKDAAVAHGAAGSICGYSHGRKKAGDRA